MHRLSARPVRSIPAAHRHAARSAGRHAARYAFRRFGIRGAAACLALIGGVSAASTSAVAQTAGDAPAAAPVVVVLRAAHMFDGTGAGLITNAVVVVTDDKITAVGPASSVTVPAGARVRLRVVLAGIEPKDNGQIIMKTQNTLEVEGSEKPALIAETLALLLPASGANRP